MKNPLSQELDAAHTCDYLPVKGECPWAIRLAYCSDYFMVRIWFEHDSNCDALIQFRVN